MSKIALEPNASGSGVFTIASPNSNTSRTLTLPDAAGTVMLTNTEVAKSQLPTGSILQVVSVVKTDTFSQAFSGNTTISNAITGLAPTITPLFSSSDLLIIVSIPVSSSTEDMQYILYRDGSPAAYRGDAAGSRTRAVGTRTKVSPTGEAGTMISFTALVAAGSTSATTFDIRLMHLSNNSNTVYVNRNPTDDDQGFYSRGAASVHILEVKK
jgi:hypothetical protein